MSKIKCLLLEFPHGANIEECNKIAQFAQDQVMAGVSEGGMMPISKYGLNVESCEFSEDTMQFIYGHNRNQNWQRYGPCPFTKSEEQHAEIMRLREALSKLQDAALDVIGMHLKIYGEIGEPDSAISLNGAMNNLDKALGELNDDSHQRTNNGK